MFAYEIPDWKQKKLRDINWPKEAHLFFIGHNPEMLETKIVGFENRRIDYDAIYRSLLFEGCWEEYKEPQKEAKYRQAIFYSKLSNKYYCPSTLFEDVGEVTCFLKKDLSPLEDGSHFVKWKTSTEELLPEITKEFKNGK